MMKEELRQQFVNEIGAYIADYRRRHDFWAADWKTPLVGFADASSPYFAKLRELVSPNHYLPADVLPEASVVLSYFLPFREEIGRSNQESDKPSAVWAAAYNETNQMFADLNAHLVRFVESLGYQAASPAKAGMIDSRHIYSNWSQRHVACAAGLGTFGVNNMLITEQGACGRLSSIVTSLPVTPDQPAAAEYCLYKRNGTCGACVRRCPIGALSLTDGFDRLRCHLHLEEFKKEFEAGVCGKCAMGMPCTFRRP